MAAENRPEEPEWQCVTNSPLNGAEEEESDWFWVDNDTCRARAEACEPGRLPKSPASKELQPSGGAAQMKPPATDVDLGGDDDWVPPGEPTEAAATPRPAVATSTPQAQQPVEWWFGTECHSDSNWAEDRHYGL